MTRITDSGYVSPYTAHHADGPMPSGNAQDPAGAVAGVTTLVLASGPFAPVAVLGGALGGAFDATETSEARAEGRRKMAEGALKVPDAWWAAANKLPDPVERQKAIARLQQIQSNMDVCNLFLQESGADPQVKALFMARLLGPGEDDSMEDGTIGDVFAVVLSGRTELLPQLMGDDGGFFAFGSGDGLDDDQWKKIQDDFLKGYGELKQAFDFKIPSPGDRVFDAYQQRTFEAWTERRKKEREGE